MDSKDFDELADYINSVQKEKEAEEARREAERKKEEEAQRKAEKKRKGREAKEKAEEAKDKTDEAKMDAWREEFERCQTKEDYENYYQKHQGDLGYNPYLTKARLKINLMSPKSKASNNVKPYTPVYGETHPIVDMLKTAWKFIVGIIGLGLLFGLIPH